MEDESIVIRAQEGDKEAFEQLYQAYKRPILNYLYRFIGNRHSAEELTQEAFVKAYMNLHKYEPRAKFSSWLYKIAGNLAKNYLRHASYDKRAEPKRRGSRSIGEKEISPFETIENGSKGPVENARTKEAEELIQQAIDKLPAHLKETVILCDIEGFSYQEASKVMNCSMMTVGSRLWRARKKLAIFLDYVKNGV